ncbi:hypothetical protein RJ639_016881, partial [Escallonia herrerae]
VARGSPFNFKCVCDPNWKRTRSDDEQNLQFLPCVIPNCKLSHLSRIPFGVISPKIARLLNENDSSFNQPTESSLDYSCMPAAPPVPAVPYNLSRFDPCYWIYCGEGTCTKNQTYTHTCQCNAGYSNLLDVEQFPCYSPCALGSDCERLGIKVSNSTSSPDGGNQATSFLPGKFHWVSILLMSGAMAIWS